MREQNNLFENRNQIRITRMIRCLVRKRDVESIRKMMLKHKKMEKENGTEENERVEDDPWRNEIYFIIQNFSSPSFIHSYRESTRTWNRIFFSRIKNPFSLSLTSFEKYFRFF